MSENSEMAAYLRAEAAKVPPDGYVPLFHPLVIELAKGLEADDEKIAGLEATIALRDDRITALESERDFLLQEIAYCTDRLRKAGVQDGITEVGK